MGSIINPFNSPFGASKPEQLPLSALAGKPAIGPGRRGRSKKNGAGSALVWELGYDPTTILTLDGASVTFPATAGGHNVVDSDQQFAVTDATGLYYVEYELVSISGAWGAGDYLTMGFRSVADAQAGPDQYASVGMCWHENGAVWYACRSATSGTALVTTSGATEPQAGDRFGIAVDNVNNDLFIHKNGVWMDNGTFGGAPGGNGFTVSNLGTDVAPHISADLNGGGIEIVMRAVIPLYLPAGYTSWT